MEHETMKFFNESREKVRNNFPKLKDAITVSEAGNLLKERGVTNLSEEVIKERYNNEQE